MWVEKQMETKTTSKSSEKCKISNYAHLIKSLGVAVKVGSVLLILSKDQKLGWKGGARPHPQ